MANILDYLEWRGDLDFKKAKFNEIDSLILSRFSYFPLDGLFKNDKKITIKEAYERFLEKGAKNCRILQAEDLQLFPAMAKSTRFGDLYITNFVNKIDKEEEKQFCAVTILLPNNVMYVSYRGTDNTLVGWKEDFKLSFDSDVPSQHDAVNYLEKVAKELKGKIMIGGHSKGGNLAVYAGIFCNDETKKRIVEVYNHDGPGMNSMVIKTNQYKKSVKKIHTYVPQSSVIGRLLYHEEQYTVIQSVEKGIMQHDLYSWQVLGQKFVTLNEVTNGSEFVDKTIKNWLENVEPEKREQVIDVVFDILNTTDAQTMKELRTNWFSSARTMMASYKNIDNGTKDMIWKAVGELLKSAKNNILGNV